MWHRDTDKVSSTPTDFSTYSQFIPTADGKQIYRHQNFQITVPAGWIERPGDYPNPNSGNLVSSITAPWEGITFFVQPIAEYREPLRSLFTAGDLLEPEKERVEERCRGTESCGKIVEWHPLNIDGARGIEVVVRNSGVTVENGAGTISYGIFRTFVKKGTVYSFWTGADIVPEAPKDKAWLNFRSITDTFKTL